MRLYGVLERTRLEKDEAEGASNFSVQRLPKGYSAVLHF